MKTLKTEAVVLKKKSLLNKDYLVTLFSLEEGKIKAFAKGAKKITSRRISHLQTGNLIEAIVNRKDDRLYLQETKLISAFSKIKENFDRLNSLYFFLFVLERILPEHQKEERVYTLTKKFLIDLSSTAENNRHILEDYLNQAIKILGYIRESKSFGELRVTIEEIINEKLPEFII